MQQRTTLSDVGYFKSIPWGYRAISCAYPATLINVDARQPESAQSLMRSPFPRQARQEPG